MRRETDDRRGMLVRRTHSAFALFVAALASAACGGSAPPPATAEAAAASPASEDGSKAPKADDAAKTAAAVEKLTESEATSGACDANHQAALEKLLDAAMESLKGKTDEAGKPLAFQLVGKKVLALSPNARSFEMSVSGRGTQVHVLAYGAKDVSMDVLVGTAAATTMRSPFQRPAIEGAALEIAGVGSVKELQSDSRHVTIKPGQPLVVKVTGQGCAGIISVMEQP